MKKKIGSDNRIPIYLRITHRRKVVYVNTGIKLLASQWNDTKKKAKPSAPSAARINTTLSSKLSRIEFIDLSLSSHRRAFTSDKIKELLLVLQ